MLIPSLRQSAGRYAIRQRYFTTDALRIQYLEVKILKNYQIKLQKLLPYLFAMFIVVYITGLAPRIYGNVAYPFSNMMLMYGLPIAAAVISFIYGSKNGFTWYFPLFFPIIFMSTIYVFYGGDTGYYLNVLVYLVFALIFLFVGATVFRKREYYKSNFENKGKK